MEKGTNYGKNTRIPSRCHNGQVFAVNFVHQALVGGYLCVVIKAVDGIKPRKVLRVFHHVAVTSKRQQKRINFATIVGQFVKWDVLR